MALIDIEIDGLTNSVLHAASLESKNTIIRWWHDIALESMQDEGWIFDWQNEINSGRAVAGLSIQDDGQIQGLISFETNEDHILVHLIESAPHNLGHNKRYLGVPGNLFAFTCLYSVQVGKAGVVAFMAKTQLMDHYKKTLNARRIGNSSRMIIDEEAAAKLIRSYFQENDRWPDSNPI